ncbi:MAG: heme ABC exporter ATP-binding protein CcmA [Rickettsiales bacterium]|nr:MAG: heme ABC exporter ATP-binding protein CcmA [Rickettsiales bacterium]
MLSLHSICFSLGNREVFKDLSLSFLPSSIIYIKGANGSGKTSLMRMLAGIQTPSSGSITFDREALPISMLEKPYCTYIGHKVGIKPELTALEHLEFWAKLYDSAELIDAAIIYFKLEEIIDKKCYELSAGMQKRVALARLIASPAKLWLLDEASSNLDSDNRQLLLNLIITHANNGGITFIACHNEPEIKTAQVLDLAEFLPNLEENKS